MWFKKSSLKQFFEYSSSDENRQWFINFILLLVVFSIIGALNSWIIGKRIPLDSDTISVIYDFLVIEGKKMQLLYATFSVWAIYSLVVKRDGRWFDLNVRIVCLVCIAMLVWTFGLFNYNYYFDQFHWIDRIAIVSLGVLSCYSPQVIPVFLISCIAVSKQFYFDNLFSYTFADKRIILTILWFCFFWHNLHKRIANQSAIFFIVTIAIIFHWYFLAGVGKINLNWISENNSFYLAYASYLHGWYHFIDNETLQTFFQFLFKSNNFFEVLALLTEVFLFLFFFYKRSWNKIIIGIYIFMHIAIFLSTGIFFWKWIILLTTLLLILLIDKHNALCVNVGVRNRILFYTLVFILPYLLRTTQLAWLDSGFVTKYSIVTSSDPGGGWKKLDSSYFSPYDIAFAQNRFNYLDKGKPITGTYGSTISHEIKNYTYEKDLGDQRFYTDFLKMSDSKFDSARSNQFYDFVKRYMNNKQNSNSNSNILDYLSPPRHIWQGEWEMHATNKKSQIGLLIERFQIKQFGEILIDSTLVEIGNVN